MKQLVALKSTGKHKEAPRSTGKYLEALGSTKRYLEVLERNPEKGKH